MESFSSSKKEQLPFSSKPGQLGEGLPFERLVQEIISTALSVEQNGYEDFGEEMDELMKQVAFTFGADRVAIFRHVPETDLLDITHKWFVDGEGHLPNVEDRTGSGFMPWVIRTAEELGYVYVRDVEQMSHLAVSERKIAAQRQFKAFLLVPVAVRDQFYGYLNLSSLTPNPHWNEDSIKALQTAAYLFANVFYRKEIGKIQEEKENRVLLAVEGSNAGIWEIIFAHQPDGSVKRTMFISSKMRAILVGKKVLNSEKVEEWDQYSDSRNLHLVDVLLVRVLTGEPDLLESEFQIQNERGQIRWIHSKGKLIRDHKDRPLKATGFAWDITERIQMQEERETLIQELEEKNTALEQFMYSISHDLKSPLITIQGYTGHIKKDLEGGKYERVLQDLSRVDRAAQKMTQLLNELLELSRLGYEIGQQEEFSLSIPLAEALELLAAKLENNDIQLQIEPSLPQIKGNRLRIREVWQNLLENAIKFTTEEAQAYIKIGTESVEREGKCLLCCYVKDNGIGIEPAFQNKVFDLFERLHPKYSGSGIGLTLVKRIMELHQGKIWLESEGNGKGTTFFLHFPLMESDPITR